MIITKRNQFFQYTLKLIQSFYQTIITVTNHSKAAKDCEKNICPSFMTIKGVRNFKDLNWSPKVVNLSPQRHLDLIDHKNNQIRVEATIGVWLGKDLDLIIIKAQQSCALAPILIEKYCQYILMLTIYFLMTIVVNFICVFQAAVNATLYPIIQKFQNFVHKSSHINFQR